MKKIRFFSVLIGLLALTTAAVFAAGPGLTLTGLGAFEGNYVIAAGKEGGTSYTAFSNTMDGARISGGRAELLVYGEGTRVYTGNATVTFDVVINEAAAVRSETVGMGSVTIKFTGGTGSGAVVGLLDMRKKSAAPAPTPAVKGALPVAEVVEYITVRVTLDGKNKYYLSSLSGEVFDFNKTAYEYSTPTPDTDEIYIFPTRKSDAMLSSLNGGPKYTTTVNDIESKSPYTYPLRKGANTFLVKYLEDTRVIRTYTIKVTSGAGTTASAPAPTPAAAKGLTVSGSKLTNGKYIVVSGSVTEGGKRYLIIGAAAPVTARTDVTGARVTGGKVVLQLYQMEQTTNAAFSPYTGSHKKINVNVYQVSQEKVNTVTGVSARDQLLLGTGGTVFVDFTNGVASVEIN